MPWQSTKHINTYMKGLNSEGLTSILVPVVVNPNLDWDLNSFTKPAKQDDGSYYAHNQENPDQYIRFGSDAYSGIVGDENQVSVSVIDISNLVTYGVSKPVHAGLKNTEDYIEFGGVYGRLSKVDVKYWYSNDYSDTHENNGGQAQNIQISTRNETIMTTRSTQPSRAYIQEYALDAPLNVWGYLKLTFLNTTNVKIAAYRINKIRFNFA